MDKDKVDFNHDEVKRYLATTLKVPEKLLHFLILPEVGTQVEINGLLFKVTYIRTNPFRVTMEPIGVVEEKEPEATFKEVK